MSESGLRLLSELYVEEVSLCEVLIERPIMQMPLCEVLIERPIMQMQSLCARC